MTKINDGGPAFPHHEVFGGESYKVQGMTLRDWFAGQAPEMPDWWRREEAEQVQPPGWKSGMNSSDWTRLWGEFNLYRIVTWRFAYADAMIAAREDAND